VGRIYYSVMALCLYLCAYGLYVSLYFPCHTGGAMGPLLTGVLANHKVGTPLHVQMSQWDVNHPVLYMW